MGCDMKRLAAALAIVLLGTSPVGAWSSPAHQAIGDAAQDHLTPQANAALARILQDTSTLSSGALAGVATWPDDLRARQRYHTIAEGWGPADIEEADQFNAANPGNDQWHFVDLPLGADGYPLSDPPPGDPLRPFVTSDDIVHALRRCISILEGTAEPNFSKRQAVRWIVHLVGDLHQPMHVTSGYYKTTLANFANKPVRINDPVSAAKPDVLADRGANGLLFSTSESNNLHATWDKCLPNLVASAACSASTRFTPLAVKLKSLITPSAIAAAKTPGDHHDWPAAWATDALHQAVASRAYPSSLKSGSVKVDHHGDADYVQAVIVMPARQAYLTDHVATAQTQLVNAAIRLGALFNAIQWP